MIFTVLFYVVGALAILISFGTFHDIFKMKYPHASDTIIFPTFFGFFCSLTLLSISYIVMSGLGGSFALAFFINGLLWFAVAIVAVFTTPEVA